ncbi:hypothetical protein BJV74DRAFT_885329 [Russula compacta]|nr:hypothetical protein BJV74DRAFT_885329 [Russula compacta]
MSKRPLTRTYAVADLSQGQPPAPVSRPPAKKRGRPPKATTATSGSTMSSYKDNQEPSAGNGDSSGDEEQPPTKKPKANDKGATASVPAGKRGKVTVPPRSPLPVRNNRVVNPGAPDRKNPRRTSAQVAAEKKRKEELQRDLDALAQRQIEILAEMEADQEMADEAEDGTPSGLLPMLRISKRMLRCQMPSPAEKDKEIVASKVPAKSARKKKASKGELRAAVDAAKEAIVKGKKKTSAPKKGKLTFPSGMTARTLPSEERKLGGLDDDDADTVQPSFGGPKNRTNNFIEVISNGNRATTAQQQLHLKSNPAPSRASNARSNASKSKSKASINSVQEVLTAETDGLPMFARVKWSTSFLPTLYCRLGSAKNPWKPYKDGSSMLDMIQEILDMVYPNSGYHVRIGDKIYSMAKDRLNEKRTYFGREAIKIVTSFFNTRTMVLEYLVAYTHDCTVPIDHPDYVKPEDLFESRFVVDLVSPFIKWCEGSCHDYGRLEGAYAMAAAGIERAFGMYHTGERVDVRQFSWELVGEMIDDYVHCATIMSQRHWITLWIYVALQTPKIVNLFQVLHLCNTGDVLFTFPAAL